MAELNQIFEAAQNCYRAGNLSEAETLYRQVLEEQPQNIAALSWLAAIAEQTGRPEVGIGYYQQVLALNPNLSEAHSNLGSLLCQQGQVAAAIAHHQQALVLSPNDPDAHYNLGVVLYQDRQLEAAVTHYQQAVQLKPDYANAHNNLGVTLSQLQRVQEAITHYQQAVLHNPNHANAHNNLGVALAQAGEAAAAIAHYQQALALDPQVPNAHDNLGTALKNVGRLEEAITHYQQAIDLKPDQPSPYDNLGTALQAQGKLEAAIAHYRQAIERDPTYANAYGNLASAIKEQGKFEQAIATCEQGLAIQPQNTHLHNVYGGILADRGDIAGAIDQFEQAIQNQPDHADTHLNLGMMLLMAGDFQRGFVEYHWRWQTTQCPNLRYLNTLWDGADLQGRVILLTAEQGFGDTIQFVRYASLVAQKGGHVVIACQKPLLRLLQTVPGVTQCVDRDRVDVDTHVHAPLLDLPLLLGTTLETIPAQVPYLSSPPDSPIQLQAFPGAGFKIGFVWATNPSNSTSTQRSCPLVDFLSLLEISNVALYSLQKDCPDDRALLKTCDRLQDLHDQIRDFADTAAAIAQLDLIISVDTAVAHLAGALGKPIWTLLPFTADWRWMRDRLDSPWYPTMRLFRQAQPDQWTPVFEDVRQALVEQLEDWEDRQLEEPETPALETSADRAIALNNQATQRMRQGELEEAVLLYRQAIELQPDSATAYSNLGIALKDLNQPEAAIAYFQQAIHLQPDRAEVYNSYGCTLIDLGKVAAAIDQFEQALRLDSTHADAHLNLGMALLLRGEFERGFTEYRWRWRNKSDLALPYPEALWDGSDLEGKTILLTAEQGFGDTIQFVRYASLVADRGGRVVLACQKSLVRLLQNVAGIDQCIDRDAEAIQTHFHAPLLELPRILGTTLNTIPAHIPYLPHSPTPPLPYSPTPHLKIGIAWSTSPTSSTATRRSCPLAHFLELLELPGVAIYSLQKNSSETDRALLQSNPIFDLDPQLQDFADTATAIAQLDLIISVDTAVAHLAGALGKPVWTLLPFAPDWRWMRDRLDSPWYPTMRLFRQEKAGDWAGVFVRVRQELAIGQGGRGAEGQGSITRLQLPCLEDGSRKLKQARYGVLLYGQNEAVDQSLDLYGEWREAALNLLRHLIRPGDTIVEVGANVGVHSLFFAKAVGTEGKVVAIELDRLIFQTLCANLALNSLTHVHAYSSGTIDNFELASCRLITLHGGTTLSSLHAASRTIQTWQPIVYVEASTQESAAIAQFLKPLGYDLYWHPVPWWNPDNFDRNPVNEFSSLTTTYLLGLPHSFGITVNGLEPVG